MTFSHARDLRTFLGILDDRWPGEVLRVDTRGKAFDLAGCDAAAFLAKLKASGKRPATLFRGFKTLSGKTWPGELLFSELATLRKQAAAMDLDGEVKFQDLAQEFFTKESADVEAGQNSSRGSAGSPQRGRRSGAFAIRSAGVSERRV